MNEYENMTMEEILAIKREKEGQLEALREEIKVLARAEERLVRIEEIESKLGNVTEDDILLMTKAVKARQVMSAGGLDSEAEVGKP
jgi:hypothetical protein